MRRITMSQDNKAYLELIIGPMFSGKTSKLLAIYNQCKFCNIPVQVINHADDIRYHDSMLSTHDKNMIPCIQAESLDELWNYNKIEEHYNDSAEKHFRLRSAKVILINEAQFFPDLFKVVSDMLRERKQVYICGLDGDFQRKRFGELLELIPLCDKVTKLTSLCSLCKNGEPGIFSMRLTKETQQTLIGSNNYIPVCRGCYETAQSATL
jgi:thymidine kinase